MGTLKSALCTLTNVTNENEEGCNAVVGDDGRGLLTIASLVPFLARNIEGFSLEDASDRRRSRTPADDSGSSLLAATLVLLVNVVEADSTTAETLRATFVSLHGARGRSRTRASFVDILTALYLHAGGADEDDAAEARAKSYADAAFGKKKSKSSSSKRAKKSHGDDDDDEKPLEPRRAVGKNAKKNAKKRAKRKAAAAETATLDS